MYRNLKAEMTREGVIIKDIAALLGVREGTVSDKLNGKYRIYYDEAYAIKTHFFPACDIEYLFFKSSS